MTEGVLLAIFAGLMLGLYAYQKNLQKILSMRILGVCFFY